MTARPIVPIALLAVLLTACSAPRALADGSSTPVVIRIE